MVLIKVKLFTNFVFYRYFNARSAETFGYARRNCRYRTDSQCMVAVDNLFIWNKTFGSTSLRQHFGEC